MTIREHIIAEAQTWIGTPYHHQACIKGIGVDCVNLPIGVCQVLNLLPHGWRPPVYSPEWHLHQHAEALQAVLRELGCQRRPVADVLPGDLLVLRYGHVCSHVGIVLAEGVIVHAVLRHAVRIQRLAGRLASRMECGYTLPGVPL